MPRIHLRSTTKHVVDRKRIKTSGKHPKRPILNLGLRAKIQQSQIICDHI